MACTYQNHPSSACYSCAAGCQQDVQLQSPEPTGDPVTHGANAAAAHQRWVLQLASFDYRTVDIHVIHVKPFLDDKEIPFHLVNPSFLRPRKTSLFAKGPVEKHH